MTVNKEASITSGSFQKVKSEFFADNQNNTNRTISEDIIDRKTSVHRIDIQLANQNRGTVNHVTNNLMHVTDWLPTLYEAAGGDPSELRGIDGISQWKSLISGGESPRREVLLNINELFKPLDGESKESLGKGGIDLLEGSGVKNLTESSLESDLGRRESLADSDEYREELPAENRGINTGAVSAALIVDNWKIITGQSMKSLTMITTLQMF